MVKQKDAVFNAIAAIRGTTDFSGQVELSSDERAAVSAKLLDGFTKKEIEYNGDTSDSKKLSSYVSGLISNWLRKDKRLNGNTKYEVKNPGTRTWSSDVAIKAMRELLKMTEDPEAQAEIQKEIDRRLGELKPKPTINVAALPESLRHLYPSGTLE